MRLASAFDFRECVLRALVPIPAGHVIGKQTLNFTYAGVCI